MNGVASAVSVGNVLYGRPLKEARAAAARGARSESSNTVSLSPLELMTASPTCCQKDCLGGNLIAGVDATEYLVDRAAKRARSSRNNS